MRLFLIILIGKIIAGISRILNLGAGGTWPGEMALLIDKKILSKFTKEISSKIIIIAGTNGKTTTAKMISEILNDKEIKILRNESGGNVLNGLVSTLVTNSNYQGKIKVDWLIFEVDEATLPLILKEVSPKIIILLNLFRDQLDRYGEVNLLADKWLSSFKKLSNETIYILNADDPQIANFANKIKAQFYFFGLNNKDAFLNYVPYAGDSTYCPNCQYKFTYENISMAHLGKWSCQNCGLKRPDLNITDNDYVFPLEGIYNQYNTLAACLTARVLKISDLQIKNVLAKFKPAFGRQEEFTINNKKIKIYLSKNPTGMNETIRTILQNQKSKIRNQKQVILLILNDRIPDGRDVSWIWDVDTEKLIDNFDQIIISGDRAYDMGLRLKYSNAQITNNQINHQISKLQIKENLREAIEEGIEETLPGETFYILPTYSGMLEVRKILTGKKIL